MPAGWGAVIGGALGLAGSAMSADAAQSAAGQQASGLQASLGLQSRMYDQSRRDLAPYMSGGVGANSLLDEYLGIGINPAGLTPDQVRMMSLDRFAQGYGIPSWNAQTGQLDQDTRTQAYDQANLAVSQANADPTGANFGKLLKPFSADDLNANLAPNYAFMLDQGQQATKNAANASGGLLGGNALQGLETFTQNYAQNAYQQAYNNYNTNMNNIFSRLSGVAQMGQNSATQTASNAISAGQNMGNTTAQIGAAQAGGTVGAANAISGGLNNLGSYYTLNSIMNGSNSGGGYNGYDVGMSDIYRNLSQT